MPRPARDDPDPPTARHEQADELLADAAAERHPADGGGRAWIEHGSDPPPRLAAGDLAHFTVVYEAGELGIAEGGSVHFLPEPFWGWSPPQDLEERRLGFTRVTSEAPGVELETSFVGGAQAGYLVITVRGRRLERGERLRIAYGADPSAAQVDRHAERESHLWLYVDGDGDGVRGLLRDSPSVEVHAGAPAMLVLHAPSVVRPGERFTLRVAVLDALANEGVEVAGQVRLQNRPAGWELPESIALPPEGHGLASIEIVAREPGVLRLAGELALGDETLRGEAPPTWVSADAARIRWADLHGHSSLSDGTGDPEDWYSYARDVAGLDVAALTDHDHFGVRFLDAEPELWTRIQELNRSLYRPGRFVPVLAYEWTSWIHGHRHVLYFDGVGEVLSSLDERYDTPRELWSALAGRPALTFAHHSAGEPIPTNWTFEPDPVLEPLTEIASVHGTSEAEDCPNPVRGARRGNFVRDVLDRGYRLGFVGSGDGHDGHPGLPHLSPVYGWLPPLPGSDVPRTGNGGLAGVLCEELTREGVLEALRARRTYATSGPRIVLSVQLAGHPFGSSLARAELSGELSLEILVIGTAPLQAIDVVRPDSVERYELHGERTFQGGLPVPAPERAGYLYVRVLQQDGALAWSSPFFFD